jgi:hypothetical protein
MAIARYLCKKLDYYPQDEEEQVQCESLIDWARGVTEASVPWLHMDPEGEEKDVKTKEYVET